MQVHEDSGGPESLDKRNSVSARPRLADDGQQRIAVDRRPDEASLGRGVVHDDDRHRSRALRLGAHPLDVVG
jgi:hypothetical protein